MTTAQDAERDERIMMEIVVDCYDEDEQMIGWYYYLEDTLLFPFTAVCTNKRSISPQLQISHLDGWGKYSVY